MSAWNVSFADYEQFFSARSVVGAGFVEFDWFSIVFGKILRFSETKKLEFSRRNLLGKAWFSAFLKCEEQIFFKMLNSPNLFQQINKTDSILLFATI